MPKLEYVTDIVRKYNIPINGVIHIGAHKFEEVPCYKHANIANEKILWIEANPNMIAQNKDPNIIVKHYLFVSDYKEFLLNPMNQ